VYRNETTLPDLLRQLAALSGEFAEPLEALLRIELPKMPFRSQLLCLSRNFGSFAAIRAGLEVARGECIAFLAADLQQPVSSVKTFFELLTGGADVAIGQRATSGDPYLSRISSRMFWGLYRRFIQHDVPSGGVDAFACTRQVRDILVSLPEANSTLVGLLFWVGFRRASFAYPRASRPTGRSGWTAARKIRYAFDTAFAFSDLPITVMMVGGAVGIIAAVAASLVVLAAWLQGSVDVRGYTPLMLAILLSFSTTLLAVGVLGGYMWRIFENTKGRPSHIVRSIEHIEPTGRVVATRERL
jgi:glycosyltransferase involved in cell wall biosynthesis